MTPAVSIVLVLGGGADRARTCLEAIAGLPAEPEYEVVLVADAAPWLEPLLAQLEGDVEIVRTERPLGPAACLERGAQRARAPICAALLDAAVPAAGWLAGLIEPLAADASVGTAFSLPPGADPARATVLDAPAAAWRTSQLHTALARPLSDAHPLAGVALTLAEAGLRSVPSPASVAAPPSAVRRVAAPGTPPELTVVIPTLAAGSQRVQRCLTAVRETTDAPHEVVIVDNGAPPQGFAGPVNAGLRAARTPYVVVMNDDVEPLPGWWPPLRDALDAGAAVSFPLTVDGAMRTDFAAWCFAATAQTLVAFGHGPGEFFDPSLVIWFQDTDLLYRLQHAGRPPELVRASHIRHGLSRTLSDPEPELAAWVRGQIAADQARFTAKHPDARLVPAVLGESA